MPADGMAEDMGAVMEGSYRYKLWRRWSPARVALFIMLNPSTADALKDDPTIRRCRSFAKGWGHGGLEVVNLFAYRATNPDTLRIHGESAIGPRNDAVIVKAALTAGIIVAAWGEKGKLLKRDASVLALLDRMCDHTIYCLGKTATGAPRHPLYVRGDVQPQRFR